MSIFAFRKFKSSIAIILMKSITTSSVDLVGSLVDELTSLSDFLFDTRPLIVSTLSMFAAYTQCVSRAGRQRLHADGGPTVHCSARWAHRPLFSEVGPQSTVQ
eukprot:TRINITY_DN69316_c0_g1_i3.p1 TRINITY_DN69316_c0_g1~~TRINITY_DN69316_c0_g1_i3.p1  ORF type:complete len:103 (-),score=10.04 TRINITY_DN69316_c0_g1_i3:130-438(-)